MSVVDISETRFTRFQSIEWWDQARLRTSKVLVIGAGALGNEAIKNLCLLGVGNLVIVDMDLIEQSNLSRSVLFTPADEGRPKAVCAAIAAKRIYPDVNVRTIVGSVAGDLGLGWFHWADVVIGAVDNREARVFINAACARVGKPWIDGGIEVLQGIARVFSPPDTACYECTMSDRDWEILNKRRSCSLLARRAAAEGGTATTPTTSSVIAGIQTQEALKLIHNLPSLAGRGFFFEGLNHSSYTVSYQVNPECGWHEPRSKIVSPKWLHEDTSLETVWRDAQSILGKVDALDLSRELVSRLSCGGCESVEDVFMPSEKIDDSMLQCRHCGQERTPDFFHSIQHSSPELVRSARELGLPEHDIIWARNSESTVGYEIGSLNTADNNPKEDENGPR